MVRERKTRQQKIITDLRRKLVSYQKEGTEELKSVATPISYPEPKSQPPTFSNSLGKATLDYSYVKGDLQRVFLWSFLIIGLEFILFWLFEKGGIQLFR